MEIRVPRFNRTQRILHWLHAVSFLLLAGSGLSVYLPPLASVVGHRALLREVHLWSAAVYVFGPLLVARLGNWRSVRADYREVDQWETGEFQWLRAFWSRRVGMPDGIGRFNPGQKLNTIFTGATGILFGVSGLVMWQGPRFPHWLTQNAILLHDGLTWLALAVWLGHVGLSLIHRESLRGMALGWVKADWARKHHRRWYEEVMTWKSTCDNGNRP